MKKYGVLIILLVALIVVSVAKAQGEAPPDHPLIPSGGRVVRPLGLERVEKAQDVEAEPITAGCGVAGEFGMTDEPCEWNPWQDDLTDWFVPELEFAWQYDE